jgi:hypothetical protein
MAVGTATARGVQHAAPPQYVFVFFVVIKKYCCLDAMNNLLLANRDVQNYDPSRGMRHFAMNRTRIFALLFVSLRIDREN